MNKIIVLAASEKSENETQVLLVIDESGSMKPQEGHVRQALKMLYTWIEEEAFYEQIDVIFFGEEVKKVNIEGIIDYNCVAQYTDVICGLNAADVWVEERINDGNRLCVIMVSDLIEDGRTNFDVHTIEEKQEKLNTVLAKWSDYEDKLNYLFITWSGVYDIDLNDTNWNEGRAKKLVNTFKYSIPNKYNVCWLDKPKDQEKTMYMIGSMLRTVVVNITGTETETVKTITIHNSEEKSIILGKFCVVYIISEEGININDSRKTNVYEPLCADNDIRLFRVDMNLADEDVVLKINTDGLESKISYFIADLGLDNIPKVHFSKVNYEEGADITFYCEVSDPYIRRNISEPLSAVFYTLDEGERKEEVIVDLNLNSEGKYEGKTSIEKKGVYYCSIVTNSGEIIVDGAKTQIKSRALSGESDDKNSQSPIQDNGGDKNKLYIAAILVISVGGFYIIAKHFRR